MRGCVFFLLTFFVLSLYVAFSEETDHWVAVEIVDSSGNAVAEARSETLSLSVNRKETPILQVTSSDRRQVVVFMDLAFSSLEGIQAARENVWRFLSSMRKEDLAAIVVYDAQNHLRLQCSFTTSHAQWLHALNHLDRPVAHAGATAYYLPPDLKEQPEDKLWDLSQTDLAKVMNTGKSEADQASDQFSKEITRLAGSLSVVRGRKEILFFSPGIPIKRVVEEANEPDLASVTSAGEDEESGGFQPSGPRPLNAAEALADAFTASNCVVHTLDLSGIGKPAVSGRDFLKTISRKTGGSYQDQVVPGLDAIRGKATRTFWIKWNQQSSTEAQEIKIRSKQNYKVLAPGKVLSPKNVAALTDLEKGLYFSQWVYGDFESKKTDYSFFLDYLPATDHLTKTLFYLQVSGSLPVDQKAKVRSFYLGGYLLDSKGELVDCFFTPVRIDVAKVSDRLTAGLSFFDPLLSSPGEYNLRGFVTDVERSETTTYVVPVRAPDFTDLSMSAPVVPTSLEHGILLRQEYAENKKRGIEVSYPYETSQGIFQPVLHPKIKKGDTCYLFFRALNLSLNSSQQPSPQFRFVLESPDGKITPVHEVALAERKAISPTDYSLLFWFKITDVPPGNYKLAAILHDANSDKTVSQTVNIEVIQ